MKYDVRGSYWNCDAAVVRCRKMLRPSSVLMTRKEHRRLFRLNVLLCIIGNERRNRFLQGGLEPLAVTFGSDGNGEDSDN